MINFLRPFYKIRIFQGKIEETRVKVSKVFFAWPHHQWIKNNPTLTKVFQLFIDILPREVLEFMLDNPHIYFINHHGRTSGTYYSSPHSHIVLIFPDIQKLLLSALPTMGLAVIAHELGHIFYHHNTNTIPLMQAQIEADFFAFKLGLGEELIGVLSEESSEECSLRLEELEKWQKNFHFYSQQDFFYIQKPGLD